MRCISLLLLLIPGCSASERGWYQLDPELANGWVKAAQRNDVDGLRYQVDHDLPSGTPLCINMKTGETVEQSLGVVEFGRMTIEDGVVTSAGGFVELQIEPLETGSFRLRSRTIAEPGSTAGPYASGCDWQERALPADLTQ
jgi:hypothetical protein